MVITIIYSQKYVLFEIIYKYEYLQQKIASFHSYHMVQGSYIWDFKYSDWQPRNMPQMPGNALEISLNFQFGPTPAIFSAHAADGLARHVRPMSDTQQSWATLSRNFVGRQSCLSDFTSCPTFDESRN